MDYHYLQLGALLGACLVEPMEGGLEGILPSFAGAFTSQVPVPPPSSLVWPLPCPGQDDRFRGSLTTKVLIVGSAPVPGCCPPPVMATPRRRWLLTRASVSGLRIFELYQVLDVAGVLVGEPVVGGRRTRGRTTPSCAEAHLERLVGGHLRLAVHDDGAEGGKDLIVGAVRT